MKWFIVLLVSCMITGCQESPAKPNEAESPNTESPHAGSPNVDSPNAKRPNAESPAGDIPYRVSVAAEGLDVPWDMDIAPDGRMFITERTGAVRVMEQGKLLPEPVYRLEKPFIAKGEGGLLGLTLDPEFSDNGYLYIYHTYEGEDQGQTYNRVIRLVERDHGFDFDRVILSDIPGSVNHNGGRIRFGPDGYLYITAGDRYEPSLAQEAHSLGGKILRVDRDGGIPEDNPFPGSPVYSLGHRNSQGLAWHPVTGLLYSSEHGQAAHDEINLIEPGANYGWPWVEGDESLGEAPELRKPLIHSWQKTWAPSGMTFVTQGPWAGQLLVANLRGQQVLKLKLDEADHSNFAEVEYIFKDWGRIRSVYEAPDGTIYLMTNNRDGRGEPVEGDDRLLRLTPNF